MSEIFKQHNISSDLHKCFRALSNPVRYEIFVQLLHEACECDMSQEESYKGNCATEISKKLEISQPTVSNHIKELVNCGLVTTERRGKKIYLFGSYELAKNFEVFGNFFVKEVTGEAHN